VVTIYQSTWFNIQQDFTFQLDFATFYDDVFPGN
jgi:hypothetical protein